MTESWQNVPHFFVTVAVDMSDVMHIHSQLDLSVNDFILAAVARALEDHPEVNSRWHEGGVETLEEINVALAVATRHGLFNPVIRNCAELSVRRIGAQAREMAARAQQGRLKADDMSNATFTVSNMGMLGVESFTAIITAPQAAALAVGAVTPEAVAEREGDVVVIPRMRVTLSADHRVLDGADAAAFLNTVRDYLEQPITLVVDD